jgi:hypothetical protein
VFLMIIDCNLCKMGFKKRNYKFIFTGKHDSHEQLLFFLVDKANIIRTELAEQMDGINLKKYTICFFTGKILFFLFFYFFSEWGGGGGGGGWLVPLPPSLNIMR